MSESSISSFGVAELRQLFWSIPPLSLELYEEFPMIVTKVQKHSKETGTVHGQPSADTETTSSGIRAFQDEIRMCAYYIYQKRGSAPGCEHTRLGPSGAADRAALETVCHEASLVTEETGATFPNSSVKRSPCSRCLRLNAFSTAAPLSYYHVGRSRTEV